MDRRQNGAGIVHILMIVLANSVFTLKTSLVFEFANTINIG